MIPQISDDLTFRESNVKRLNKEKRTSFWYWYCRFSTILIPQRLLKFSGLTEVYQIRAWREKFTLCILIAIICGIVLSLLIIVPLAICPHIKTMSFNEFSRISIEAPHTIVHGIIYDISGLPGFHRKNGALLGHLNEFSGKDASSLFPWAPNIHPIFRELDDGSGGEQPKAVHNKIQYNKLVSLFPHYVRAYSYREIEGLNREACAYVTIEDKIYTAEDALRFEPNLSPSARKILSDPKACEKTAVFKDQTAPQDIILLKRYFAGIIEPRMQRRCRYVSYYHLGCSALIVIFIALKLFAVFRYQMKSNGTVASRPTVVLVSCYVEDEDTIKGCINAIANMQTDSGNCLLFIVIDGIAPVNGTAQLNVEAIFSALGRDDVIFDESDHYYEYQSLKGPKNVIIRCGIYEIRGQKLPYAIVVKMGDGMNFRNGNCGKRDSQLILLHLLSKIHQGSLLSEFETELLQMISTVCLTTMEEFEYLLMVDADTEVSEKSLAALTRRFLEHEGVIGVCGETKVGNETASWVTSMQVFEYFVSFNLTKAFESLFGMVTCLPGCFSMYRILSASKNGNIPLIVKPELLQMYSITDLYSVHQKNLLDLGEDRYLTTLIINFFPNSRLEYVPDAWCHTKVPETFAAFLNQRRRWINSTVHNLIELMKISMLSPLKFIVLCDLFTAVISPASVIYTIFLLLQSYTNGISMSPAVLMLFMMYGLEASILIKRGTWGQLFWLICHILAFPITGFLLPVYAFWHFDNYTWSSPPVETI